MLISEKYVFWLGDFQQKIRYTFLTSNDYLHLLFFFKQTYNSGGKLDKCQNFLIHPLNFKGVMPLILTLPLAALGSLGV